MSLPYSPIEESVEVLTLSSPYQHRPVSLRLYAPPNLPSNAPLLFVLPVEPEGESQYGDGFNALLALDLPQRFGFVAIAPAFSELPWYADHPSDLGNRQESHLLHCVLPTVEARYPNATRLLLGFSKSGWGAMSLLLRHPETFHAAALWDAPLMVTQPNAFEMERVFANQAHFDGYCLLSRLHKTPVPLHNSLRIALLGYGNFQAHHADMHASLLRLGVPHHYENEIFHEHHWQGGWLENAVTTLLQRLSVGLEGEVGT